LLNSHLARESGSTGVFNWAWINCCTDGLVIGPMPSSDWEMRLSIASYTGLNIMRIGSYNETSRGIDFVTAALSAPSEVVVSGLTYALHRSNCDP
jgi:hypothetical protein